MSSKLLFYSIDGLEQLRGCWMRLFYILCQLVQELKGVLEHPEHPPWLRHCLDDKHKHPYFIECKVSGQILCEKSCALFSSCSVHSHSGSGSSQDLNGPVPAMAFEPEK